MVRRALCIGSDKANFRQLEDVPGCGKSVQRRNGLSEKSSEPNSVGPTVPIDQFCVAGSLGHSHVTTRLVYWLQSDNTLHMQTGKFGTKTVMVCILL